MLSYHGSRSMLSWARACLGSDGKCKIIFRVKIEVMFMGEVISAATRTAVNMHISGASAINDVCMNAATLAPLMRGMAGNNEGGPPSLRC